MSRQSGFGLLEVMLALSLGLVLLAGSGHLFLAASQSWLAQSVAAQLQEDARQALQRLAQDIRMAGMFGCLDPGAIDFVDPAAADAFTRPVELTRAADGRLQRLTLISAEVTQASGRPNWTMVTDCRSVASVHTGDVTPGAGQFAIAIRRQDYRLVGEQLYLGSGASNAVLVDGVADLRVELVRNRTQAVSGMHLTLTMNDPHGRVRPQTYRMNVALGNPVSGS
ncbi:PilW family protein [Pseudomonas sp. BJa5]|uniref:PilW family protein n=1 Tax=Pseudomonas sp. BJa5 TaxID=2936270 RepID=UPI002559B245|nr:prepilin-type N-terminal cleavage/methylation domain-containing protein [Pseudomonas sp. BGr12]MDL2423218.1 prepilin-type N-terminal cleavage/methylation domain-containing protein [Pseudomonas sp. BGr12]